MNKKLLKVPSVFLFEPNVNFPSLDVVLEWRRRPFVPYYAVHDTQSVIRGIGVGEQLASVWLCGELIANSEKHLPRSRIAAT
ncbi:hypothetical protein IscW_ISCW010042 [Ixodes scapularis]|uniref:Uncharacterized protein n=1 Tax=Ixodes scapularis TaxID=6945 RepID=B7Q330_IXOSC|nr:hypothetical protein IscW_ISCW010042 [Ixodes scapularis]|eukprot:XP_002411128.1 hypothetical protein IscW_ISCW010042 [Ixodes scapularis]